jgi:hypothetical protein
LRVVSCVGEKRSEDARSVSNDGTSRIRWRLFAGLYVASFAVLIIFAAQRWGWGVLIAAVLLAVTSLTLHWRLRKYPATPKSRLWRLALPAFMVFLGLVLLALRSLGRTEGLGFSGICMVFLGMGQLLIEWRSPRSRRSRLLTGGFILVGLCAAGFLVGLVGISNTLSVWAIALIAFGILASPVGLSLVSGGELRRLERSGDIPQPRHVLVVGCVAIVSAGIWLLVLMAGIEVRYALIIGVTLFVMVGAITSNTPADVLIVVVVVALLWALAPRGVSPSDAVIPNHGETVAAALGDSYMSGEGAKKFYNGTNHKGENACRRAPTAYAPLVVAQDSLAVPQDLAFVACSGAKAVHIYERSQYPGEPIGGPEQSSANGSPKRGLSQLGHLDWLIKDKDIKVAIVIVSIGGNEAQFGEIGRSCIGPGDCTEIADRWLKNLTNVAPSVDRVYQEIRNYVGNDVPVLVVPYPIPISPKRCSESLLTANEHRFLHGFVGELNRVLERAAADAGLYYLRSMATALEERGLRICDNPAGKVGVNFIGVNPVNGRLDENVNPRNWFHNSLHPNERGHFILRDVLQAWLEAHPGVEAKKEPADQQGLTRIKTLEEVMGDDHYRHCGSSVSKPAHCDGTVADWTVAQVTNVTWRSLLPLLLVIVGTWVLWIQLIRWWRRSIAPVLVQWWRRRMGHSNERSAMVDSNGLQLERDP